MKSKVETYKPSFTSEVFPGSDDISYETSKDIRFDIHKKNVGVTERLLAEGTNTITSHIKLENIEIDLLKRKSIFI